MPKARILVVDDDPMVRETLSGLLSRRGHAVRSAEDGPAALSMAREEHFDLLITDFGMAPMDGLMLLEKIKAIHPDMVVVLISGQGDHSVVVEALRRGADDFLTKPIASDALHLRIEVCLKKRAMILEMREQQQLRLLQERAIDAMDQGLVICASREDDLPIIYMNSGFQRLTGYSWDEALGRNMRFLQGEKTDRKTVGRIDQALKHGNGFFGELVNYRKDGSPFWNQLAISPLYDESGVPTHFIATLMDISERKASQEALNLQGHLLDNVRESIIATDLDGMIIYWGHGAEALYGHQRMDALGKPYGLILPDNRDGRWPDLLARIVETGYWQDEQMMQKADGTTFRAETQITLARDRTGTPTALVGISRDITHRKEIETSLRESETRFRQLTENLEEVFILAKPRMGPVLYVNPAYERIWGQPCAALYLSQESRLKSVHAEDRLRVMGWLNSDISEKYEIEYRVLHRDGGVRWIREKGFPIFNNAGEPIRVACILTDFTREKQLADQSRQQMEQIIQADRLSSLGSVVAGVAHEINNPNSFITYNIPMLEETWNLFKPIIDAHVARSDESGHDSGRIHELMTDMVEIIEAIQIGSERINQVVTNLKDFARLDESDDKRPVAVNAVVEKTMAIVGAHLRRHAESITINLAPNLPAIPGHSQKLEQVVANLMINASLAITDRVGGKIRVTTRYVERLHCVLVEIEDNGCGIHADHLRRIFEPFFTTRRTSGGTGLGLSVSHGLVREHGGAIGVLSRPGIGSRFTVYLPIDPEGWQPPHPTILCVDDQEAVLKLVRSILMRVDDAFVETTPRPEAVLAFLESHPEVDIVLSDVAMPGFNGWDLLKAIKMRYPLVSVILFSGQPDKLEAPEGAPFQPDSVMSKPFGKRELVAALSSVGRQRI